MLISEMKAIRRIRENEKDILPIPNGLPKIPSNAPSPPLDPPHVKEVLKGFKVRPQKESHSNLFACTNIYQYDAEGTQEKD